MGWSTDGLLSLDKEVSYDDSVSSGNVTTAGAELFSIELDTSSIVLLWSNEEVASEEVCLVANDSSVSKGDSGVVVVGVGTDVGVVGVGIGRGERLRTFIFGVTGLVIGRGAAIFCSVLSSLNGIFFDLSIGFGTDLLDCSLDSPLRRLVLGCASFSFFLGALVPTVLLLGTFGVDEGAFLDVPRLLELFLLGDVFLDFVGEDALAGSFVAIFFLLLFS